MNKLHFIHKWYYESPVSRICKQCGKMQTMDCNYFITDKWYTKYTLDDWKERSAVQSINYIINKQKLKDNKLEIIKQAEYLKKLASK